MKPLRADVIDTILRCGRWMESHRPPERPDLDGDRVQSGRWAAARTSVVARAGCAGGERRTAGTRRDMPRGACRSAYAGGGEARRANGRGGRGGARDRRGG